MMNSSENSQNRICIYITNAKMITILKEMYPNSQKLCHTIWELDTTITLQDNWIVNSFYEKPNGRHCKKKKIPIIRTAKQLLNYKLLLLLGLPFDEINDHLLENSL
jgi:hypothetical protein